MAFKLTEEQIKMFVEKFGDGDVYFSHKVLKDGTIKVRYFPVLKKYVSEEIIPELFKEMQEYPHRIPKYTRELYLTEKSAYVLFDGQEVTNTLTNNYAKFLKKERVTFTHTSKLFDFSK
ncbi:MAG: hypothetical protein J6J23_06835 [Clostridia bacterium]|nr:hypothetical protein [Clostridia bacterium]